jgi:sugar phosphate isomerase/epimerase
MACKIAAQMFTAREHTKTAPEFADTLKKLSDIGYPAVQLSAVGCMNDGSVSAKEAKKMLDDNGITCIATHRPWPELMNNTDKEIEFHKELGCDFAAIGGIGGEYEATPAGYRKWIRDAGPVIDKLKAAGIGFGHHNHAKEFKRVDDPRGNLEEILIEEGPKNLLFELDLYWIEHAGLNCVRIVERCKGRMPVIHIKDKEVAEGNDTRMAPIGEGNLDWDHIIPACEAAGTRWYCVEQDQCYRDVFDCMRSSFDYLKSKGL